MKSNQHPKDSFISQEVEALRSVEPSEARIQQAQLAFLGQVKTKAPRRVIWSLATGTAICAVAIVGLQVVPQRALANEIKKIGAAQRAQQTRFCRSYQLRQGKELRLAYEEWLDGKKSVMTFFNADRSIQGLRAFDGRLSYQFNQAQPESNQPAYASLDDTGSLESVLETVDDYMNIPAIKGFTRKEGVSLNGRVCDFYTFGHGSYQIYVDPKTRLPIQREIVDHGVIIERDTYEYPVSIPKETFAPALPGGLTYYDFPAHRAALRERLSQTGIVQTIGSAKVELKQAIVGNNEVTAIWKATDSKSGRALSAKVSIGGSRTFLQEEIAMTNSKGEHLTASRFYVVGSKPPTPLPLTFSVEGGATAQFVVDTPMFSPSSEQLLRPRKPVEGQAVAADKR